MRLLLSIAGLTTAANALAVRADGNVMSSTAVATPTAWTGFPTPTQYTLPQDDQNLQERNGEIKLKRDTITYVPSIIGETSLFMGGSVGTQIVRQEQAKWIQDLTPVQQDAFREGNASLKAIQDHGGLKTLEDYKILYDGHWSGSVPGGIAQGQFSNFTSDLLFAMERLSINPYVVRRLNPESDILPFSVDANNVTYLTGTTLDALFKSGSLFLADHSYQAEYTTQDGRYSAACQALFFLDQRSGQFLPLAIKTNVGSDLVYTPLDDPNDWLLAKIMYNVNDFFHGQIYHLANSHAVAEIVNLAAIRTLSSRHPVFGLLQRLMFQAYAIRATGEVALFNPGGLFDQSFAFSNVYARKFATDFYPTVAGPFQANYFEEDLRARGLLNASYGPELSDFPFHEDGQKISSAIRRFIGTFVDTIYESDKVLNEDSELQAWITEANGPAKVIDFPSAPLNTRKQLVEILTHMAWLTGVSHHVLNQGEPFTTSGVLPLHPASLYAPVPTAKGGNKDLLPWLPNEQKSVEQISLLARFNRPKIVENNETLLHMFNVETLLSGTGEAVKAANEQFMKAMGTISKEISTRKFDDQGLSQGMPFIWTGMDPGVIPFYLSV
ncbi:Manganese lipoxygenase [Colletotrichum siamense]|nr:Manganese lipoxygenase [Colletotrichum siamense]KAF4864884.1 Manganese lipoxygenase [Colletotrichum siamense]